MERRVKLCLREQGGTNQSTSYPGLPTMIAWPEHPISLRRYLGNAVSSLW